MGEPKQNPMVELVGEDEEVEDSNELLLDEDILKLEAKKTKRRNGMWILGVVFFLIGAYFAFITVKSLWEPSHDDDDASGQPCRIITQRPGWVHVIEVFRGAVGAEDSNVVRVQVVADNATLVLGSKLQVRWQIEGTVTEVYVHGTNSSVTVDGDERTAKFLETPSVVDEWPALVANDIVAAVGHLASFQAAAVPPAAFVVDVDPSLNASYLEAVVDETAAAAFTRQDQTFDSVEVSPDVPYTSRICHVARKDETVWWVLTCAADSRYARDANAYLYQYDGVWTVLASIEPPYYQGLLYDADRLILGFADSRDTELRMAVFDLTTGTLQNFTGFTYRHFPGLADLWNPLSTREPDVGVVYSLVPVDADASRILLRTQRPHEVDGDDTRFYWDDDDEPWREYVVDLDLAATQPEASVTLSSFSDPHC